MEISTATAPLEGNITGRYGIRRYGTGRYGQPGPMFGFAWRAAALYTRYGMNPPKVVILRTAGTNCDAETAYAWQLAGADPRPVHVRELIDRPTLLQEYAILTLPGGFSYGDDISAGKILATQLIHHLSETLRAFVDRGGLVLGICNGFQVLVKAALLPGDPEGPKSRPWVTLAGNDSARFEARWVHLKTAGKPSPFLPADTILEMPVAHGEGKLVAQDDTARQRLLNEGHVALTYCDAEGRPGPYPINPNGSEAEIAGLIDTTGRILGLMPHPERHVRPTQHPEWTRRRTDRADGRVLFESAVRAVRT
jgi:phosphoribosylformylglycinamidine synthase